MFFAANTAGLYVGPAEDPFSAFYFSTDTNAWVSSVGLGVTGNSTFLGNTILTGPTQVIGNMYNVGDSIFSGNTYQTGETFITGNATIAGNTNVVGNTYVLGNTFVVGPATITGNLLQTGQATYVVNLSSENIGAVEITGNTDGTFQTPINTGVMLHITGQYGNVSRFYNDGQNNYALINGRRYDGSVTSLSLANADILRVAGTPYTSAGWANIGPSRISFVTNEAQTATNQGGQIDF
jgi:hypothetical protein